jgi:hypothetical protein
MCHKYHETYAFNDQNKFSFHQIFFNIEAIELLWCLKNSNT